MQGQLKAKNSSTGLKPVPPSSSTKSLLNNSKYISPKTNRIIKSNNINTNTSQSTGSLSVSSTDNKKTTIVKTTANNINKSTNSINEVLYEVQELEPAPGTTYHQLVVYAPLSNPQSTAQIARKNGAVVLREWPRLRYSQKYTRDGGPNPQEVTISYEEFMEIVGEKTKNKSMNEIQDEKLCAIPECSSKLSQQQKLEWVTLNQINHNSNLKEKIISIYGHKRYDEIIAAVKRGIVISEEKKKQENNINSTY